jgi:hypothetical protein
LNATTRLHMHRLPFPGCSGAVIALIVSSLSLRKKRAAAIFRQQPF